MFKQSFRIIPKKCFQMLKSTSQLLNQSINQLVVAAITDLSVIFQWFQSFSESEPEMVFLPSCWLYN